MYNDLVQRKQWAAEGGTQTRIISSPYNLQVMTDTTKIKNVLNGHYTLWLPEELTQQRASFSKRARTSSSSFCKE